MPSVTYHNASIAYIGNDPNQTTTGQLVAGIGGGPDIWAQSTGWHFLPNNLYMNWMTPKQWFDLVTNHSAFRLASIKITVQNLIPLTDNLSIAQDSTFMSFNNTIYALGYTDDTYECITQEEQTAPLFREGVIFNQPATGAPTISGIIGLPKYTHYLPTEQRTIDAVTKRYPLAIYSWDPLTRANHLSELRPGKNAIEFKWSRNSVDDDKWYSTAMLYAFENTGDVSNKPQFGSLLNNAYAAEWMTPSQLQKTYPTIDDNPFAKRACVVYQGLWKYPIPMMFIKMIPIYGTNKQQLKHSAQVVINREISFDVTSRTNTTNFPQLNQDFMMEWPALFATMNEPAPPLINPFKTYMGLAWQPCEQVGQQAPQTLENKDFPPP